MPNPKPDEDKEDFVSRCIRQTLNDGTTDDPKQAAAICYSKWGEDKKSRDNKMNMAANKHIALLEAIKSRNGRGIRLGQGIWTADKYAGSLLECVGPGLCNSTLAGSLKNFSAVMKQAAGTLTYAGPYLEIEKDSFGDVKLATSTASIKTILKDIELPKHSMLAFTHVLTTPREDRDGDVLETEGAVVDEKMPLLWQHVHTLPIGRMLKVVEHTKDRLKLASVLLDLNQLTSDAAKLFEAGALRFSHGFRALDFAERNKEVAGALGFRVKAYEIMEESGVSVPSNIDAEVELLSRGKLKSEVFKMHAKAMQKLLPKAHRGVDMQFKSLSDLKAAMDNGIINAQAADAAAATITVKGGAPGMDATAGRDASAAAAHDHPHTPGKTGDCGCGGKCGKCGDQKQPANQPAIKAAMERESYSSQDEASRRSVELGCTGWHIVLGANGAAVWRPCTDPYELGLHMAQPPDTQQNKPPVAGIDAGRNSGGPADAVAGSSAGSSAPPNSGAQPPATGISQGGASGGGGRDVVTGGSASGKVKPAPPTSTEGSPSESHISRDWTLGKSDAAKAAKSGVKMWMDASSLKGSYGYRQMALSNDAARFLTASGISIDRDDSVYCWAMFDDSGIICVSDNSGYGPGGDQDCDYYRASWNEGDEGEPSWTGTPQEVAVSSDINIAEVTKNMSRMLATLSTKVGRTLSKVNIEKLQQIRDDLAELNGKELPRSVTALAERCMRVIEDVLQTASPIVDDDPQPKHVSERDAATVLLSSSNVKLLQQTVKGINAVLSVHRADEKANQFRKLMRR